MAAEGLKTCRSRFTAPVTVGRLKEAVAVAGLTLFAHIDQAAVARGAGLTLAPLDLLLFGNPRAGTPLMEARPTVGIDLPLKAIVWQDPSGAAWLGFNDPAWIARRHDVGTGYALAIDGMARLQAKLAAHAAGLATGLGW